MELDSKFHRKKKKTEASFRYCDVTKELWDSIEAANAQKRTNARILELMKEIVGLKHGE